jgi:hypothetical protein
LVRAFAAWVVSWLLRACLTRAEHRPELARMRGVLPAGISSRPAIDGPA